MQLHSSLPVARTMKCSIGKFTIINTSFKILSRRNVGDKEKDPRGKLLEQPEINLASVQPARQSSPNLESLWRKITDLIELIKKSYTAKKLIGVHFILAEAAYKDPGSLALTQFDKVLDSHISPPKTTLFSDEFQGLAKALIELQQRTFRQQRVSCTHKSI